MPRVPSKPAAEPASSVTPPPTSSSEVKKPPRDHFPISYGREPQWDLSEVHTNYLLAELIRRGWAGSGKPAVAAKPVAEVKPKPAPQPVKSVGLFD